MIFVAGVGNADVYVVYATWRESKFGRFMKNLKFSSQFFKRFSQWKHGFFNLLTEDAILSNLPSMPPKPGTVHGHHLESCFKLNSTTVLRHCHLIYNHRDSRKYVSSHEFWNRLVLIRNNPKKQQQAVCSNQSYQVWNINWLLSCV